MCICAFSAVGYGAFSSRFQPQMRCGISWMRTTLPGMLIILRIHPRLDSNSASFYGFALLIQSTTHIIPTQSFDYVIWGGSMRNLIKVENQLKSLNHMWMNIINVC